MWTKVFLVIILLYNSNKVLGQDIFELQKCNGRPSFLDTLSVCKSVKKNMVFTTGLKYKQGLFFTSSTDILADICYYQHPTWQKAGTLGRFFIEPLGDIYVVPVPYINTYYNDFDKQNTLYKVESNTGIMDSVFRLTGWDKINNHNPFGLMGITYDCSAQSLYVSTIAGSNFDKNNGKIYKIEITNKEELILKDSIEGINALSLAMVNIGGVKRLLYGDADVSEVRSIVLDQYGNFTKFSHTEIKLDIDHFMTSHKAVGIRFLSDTKVEIEGVYFDFTLAIPGSHEKNLYTYEWNHSSKKWELIQVDIK